MQDMARYGRNGDTMMAHVAPGEMVVPQDVLQGKPRSSPRIRCSVP